MTKHDVKIVQYLPEIDGLRLNKNQTNKQKKTFKANTHSSWPPTWSVKDLFHSQKMKKRIYQKSG